MRESIERVIEVLTDRFESCIALESLQRADAFETAINMLKEVLNEPTEDRQGERTD